MKNADLPITPIVMDNGHPYHASSVAFDNTPLLSGLTKREHFAAMAMQGILSNTHWADRGDHYTQTVVDASMLYADALLKELEK